MPKDVLEKRNQKIARDEENTHSTATATATFKCTSLWAMQCKIRYGNGNYLDSDSGAAEDRERVGGQA